MKTVTLASATLVYAYDTEEYSVFEAVPRKDVVVPILYVRRDSALALDNEALHVGVCRDPKSKDRNGEKRQLCEWRYILGRR